MTSNDKPIIYIIMLVSSCVSVTAYFRNVIILRCLWEKTQSFRVILF